VKDSGILLHAKHAYMPNSLGYCGPDDRGLILRHIEESKGGEDLSATLKGFEAAYPFLRLIARSTGREVYDYRVPEAYWIGNSLLDRVQTPEFYRFSHHELVGKDPKEVKRVFKAVGGRARPHHTFYVMSTYATSSVADGPNLTQDGRRKVQGLIDNCRVSWGQVEEVGRKKLTVRYRPIGVDDGGLALSAPVVRRVDYNPEVRSFSKVKPGDWVTMHWGYACEVVTQRQLKNIAKYTEMDIRATNEILKASPGSARLKATCSRRRAA
jgi:hydrogenase maturation factor